jgi:iron complex outermembrane receptor protein
MYGNMLRQVFLIMILFIPLAVRSQDIADTVHLEDLVIHGKAMEKYAVGYKIIRLDSMELGSGEYRNLSQLLGRKIPLFFKSYGNGMISTISFRGTGPSHTAVFWNGLPLNQASVGQADFSLLPVIAADKAILQFGPASPMAGSGAIGGSILLSTLPAWHQEFLLGVSQDFTDFGQSYTSLTSGISGKKAGSRTRMYLNANPNSFTFKNITRAGEPLEQQKNARVSQAGILQDVFFKTGKYNRLKVSGWYNDSVRELQPVMSDRSNDDELREKSFRIATDFIIDRPKVLVNFMSGYLWDYYLYNRTEMTMTSRYLFKGEASKKIDNRFDLRAGAQIDHINATADAYPGRISETYLDLYSNILWNVTPGLDIGTNVRQQFSTVGYSPFAPSAGINLLIISRAGLDARWTAQVARSYRIPTLNDRYWMPGGNPGLNPEKGGSVETGLAGKLVRKDFRANLTTNVFHMRINDWILWIPEGEFWSAKNVREVWSSGIELNLVLEQNFGPLRTRLASAYSYNSAIDHSLGVDFGSIYGKQLPYTPEHNGRIALGIIMKTWYGFINYEGTGKRYITADNSDMLPRFTIIDAGLGKKINLLMNQLTISFQVNNIFNTDYQVMSLRAMPRRNYGFSMKYMFNGNYNQNENNN